MNFPHNGKTCDPQIDFVCVSVCVGQSLDFFYDLSTCCTREEEAPVILLK